MASALARAQNGSSLERTAPWSPFRDMFGFDPLRTLGSNWAYEYDVTRTEAGYQVEVPVPGYKADHIEVTFKDGILSVTGKNDRRSFARSFTIPEDIDADNIAAEVDDGMLVLTLNRRPEAQPKRISIKSR
jgi:HSP20 family protein